MAIEIIQPNVIVVEGKDDELFFSAFIKHLGLANIQIIPIGGKTELRPKLNALVTSPNFSQVTSLGIVRDADANPATAFQSMCDALRQVNLPVPHQTLVRAGNNPQVVVMVLPDKDTPGELEDLCLQAVVYDPAIKCVDQYFLCLQQNGISSPKSLSKAKIHAFLASRTKPDLRLGEAAQKGYWPWNTQAFENVKKFLYSVVSG